MKLLLDQSLTHKNPDTLARPSDPMTLKLPEVQVPVEKPKLAKSGGSDFNVLAPAGAFDALAGAGILAL
ncbi:hypothetical protein CYJ25_08335 [Schaalia turicensis]|uniref:Uncharacterized protein n=1 Tax=Schaalia turicensis TaxID=131111 RepID=A0A2I1I3M6_9ACTO|nr:hypothetical protein CYJ25_08335 [Schaalia turicensis]